MPEGTVAAARLYLANLPLSRFAVKTKDKFQAALDRTTNEFKKGLPSGSWGAARKFLNIFLRNVVYNRYLSDHYRLAHIVEWLEVPLDSHVARGLREEPGGEELTRWGTIIRLPPETSQEYQDFAATVAKEKGYNRVHLDLIYWRRPRRLTGGAATRRKAARNAAAPRV
jgi:hypothetical protein